MTTTRETIRNKMMQYLDRIEETRRREGEKQQSRILYLTKFQAVASEIIKPIMETMAHELENEVCRFRIDGDFTSPTNPQIRFWITPKGINLNEYDFKDVPHIFYTVDPTTGVIFTHISTIVKGRAGRLYDGSNYKLEEITCEMVERDILKVMNELMDNILS